MILVFRYYPAVESNRHVPTGAPDRLIHYASYLNRDLYSAPQEEGEYVVFEAKGEPGEDGIKPRFELTERLKVHPVEPATPRVSKVKALGN